MPDKSSPRLRGDAFKPGGPVPECVWLTPAEYIVLLGLSDPSPFPRLRLWSWWPRGKP